MAGKIIVQNVISSRVGIRFKMQEFRLKERVYNVELTIDGLGEITESVINTLDSR